MRSYIRKVARGVEFGFYDPDTGYEMEPALFYDAVYMEEDGYYVVMNGIALLKVACDICTEV